MLESVIGAKDYVEPLRFASTRISHSSSSHSGILLRFLSHQVRSSALAAGRAKLRAKINASSIPSMAPNRGPSLCQSS